VTFIFTNIRSIVQNLLFLIYTGLLVCVKNGKEDGSEAKFYFQPAIVMEIDRTAQQMACEDRHASTKNSILSSAQLRPRGYGVRDTTPSRM
jgi:hypothetical protein